MNLDRPREIVVDTGPLSHLAKAGWLSVLRYAANGSDVIITEGVKAELTDGLHKHAHLQQVLDAQWICTKRLTSDREHDAFKVMAERLVVGTRNVGEAEVLAYAKEHDAVAVVDDGAGRKAARDHGVTVKGTLAVLCDEVRAGRLTVEMVSELADHLIETDYRLPFAPGGFKEWAGREGLC